MRYNPPPIPQLSSAQFYSPAQETFAGRGCALDHPEQTCQAPLDLHLLWLLTVPQEVTWTAAAEEEIPAAGGDCGHHSHQHHDRAWGQGKRKQKSTLRGGEAKAAWQP